MRKRLPLLLLTALVALLFVNFGKALTREQIDAPAEAPEAKAKARHASSVDGEGERMIDRRFDVSDGDQLHVGVAHVDVEVVTGATGEAHVEVFLAARDMERARRYFEDLRFEVEKQGSTVTVTTNQRSRMNWSFDRNGGARIRVRVAIPETFDADLNLAHGDLDLGSLNGRAEIRSAHGDVRTAAVRGEAVSIEMAHGDLKAERFEAEEVTIRAAHGDLSLDEILAANLDAEVAHGDIEINAFEGHADVTDAHGDIEVRFTKSSGFRIENSHGDVNVHLPSDIPGDLDLSGSNVRVASAFRFEGTLRDNRAEGQINGGGPRMEARTTHGSITLHTD